MATVSQVLRFRDADAGGHVKIPPDLHEFRPTRQRLLLLIHGFNTTVPEAQEAYAAFLRLQREVAGLSDTADFAPDMDVVQVFWTGDAWGVASPLYYMHAIPNARATGAGLAQVLSALAAERQSSVEVNVVAHSLGTRLTLEFLRSVQTTKAVRVGALVFFAAATATFMLEPPDSHGLRAALANACGNSLSLYSMHDMVLALTFPPGQTLAAGDEGFFPTALGHELWDGPGAGSAFAQKENRGAGHGDYWGRSGDKPDCEWFAATQAHAALGLATAGPRTLSRTNLVNRDLVEAFEPAIRDLASRQVEVRVV